MRQWHPMQPAPNDLGLWTRFADNVIYGIPGRPLDTVTAFLAADAPAPAPASAAAAPQPTSASSPAPATVATWNVALFRAVTRAAAEETADNTVHSANGPKLANWLAKMHCRQ